MKLLAWALALSLSQAAWAFEVIGLLELPKLHPMNRPAGFKPTPIKLYEKPDLKSYADTAVTEDGIRSIYLLLEKHNPVLVSRRQGDFYEVSYTGEMRWIHKSDWGKFWPYDRILKEYSAKITSKFWDRKVFDRPGGKVSVVPEIDDEPEIGRTIKVLEIKVVNRQTWVKVELYGKVCEGPPMDEPLKTGWIPTHNVKGDLVVWIVGMC